METRRNLRMRAATVLLLIALAWFAGIVGAVFAGKWIEAALCLGGTLTALLGVGACGLGDEG